MHSSLLCDAVGDSDGETLAHTGGTINASDSMNNSSSSSQSSIRSLSTTSRLLLAGLAWPGWLVWLHYKFETFDLHRTVHSISWRPSHSVSARRRRRRKRVHSFASTVYITFQFNKVLYSMRRGHAALLAGCGRRCGLRHRHRTFTSPCGTRSVCAGVCVCVWLTVSLKTRATGLDLSGAHLTSRHRLGCRWLQCRKQK